NIQMYAYKCLNYQVVKESKKELEFVKAVSEIIEKMIMKFLHNKIYVNYEMLYEILTDISVNL
ncbi:hypothetical protein BDBG_18034, partial [Blastomyces gilchristii SLH14081]